eukprot:TRINITY_DN4589_c0_g1_i18.p2 TRINITY_DN4589_c0_g1~~TRINITY_DN4589_c0_g1_i18.p2  ORF type:complete len:178 (+),score=19.87 TRINITY_DN4589_c0_g1_i18:267-800(+)
MATGNLVDTRNSENESNEITLVWEKLTVRVPVKSRINAEEHKLINERPMKTLVESLTGVARPNEIIGLLGPSGSGKTVLLNIISSRLHPPPNSEYTRNVFVNKRQPLTRDLFGKIGAYVMQDDVLLETLTPLECLAFSANLRLSGTQEEKDRCVMKVIGDLRLDKCMNTMASFRCER